MSEDRGKRVSHRRFYIVLVLAIALVCLLVTWLIYAAAGITSGFTKDMNAMYLREMTNLTQANFKSGLSMRYSGLWRRASMTRIWKAWKQWNGS